MKLKIELNEDLIKLIENIKFKRINDSYFGIDVYDLFGGTYLYEQMALILGYADKIIPESIESPFGAEYEEEYQQKMEIYDAFIVENIVYIEEILHQFCSKGLKPGIYTCFDYKRLWEYTSFK